MANKWVDIAKNHNCLLRSQDSSYKSWKSTEPTEFTILREQQKRPVESSIEVFQLLFLKKKFE